MRPRAVCRAGIPGRCMYPAKCSGIGRPSAGCMAASESRRQGGRTLKGTPQDAYLGGSQVNIPSGFGYRSVARGMPFTEEGGCCIRTRREGVKRQRGAVLGSRSKGKGAGLQYMEGSVWTVITGRDGSAVYSNYSRQMDPSARVWCRPGLRDVHRIMHNTRHATCLRVSRGSCPSPVLGRKLGGS